MDGANRYCPVTMFDTPGWDGLELGHQTCMVKYKHQVYMLGDEAKLRRFMRKPDVYVSQHLPTKLPPRGRRMSASVRAPASSYRCRPSLRVFFPTLSAMFAPSHTAATACARRTVPAIRHSHTWSWRAASGSSSRP